LQILRLALLLQWAQRGVQRPPYLVRGLPRRQVAAVVVEAQLQIQVLER
jgi:hypothetical protein